MGNKNHRLQMPCHLTAGEDPVVVRQLQAAAGGEVDGVQHKLALTVGAAAEHLQLHRAVAEAAVAVPCRACHSSQEYNQQTIEISLIPLPTCPHTQAYRQRQSALHVQRYGRVLKRKCAQ